MKQYILFLAFLMIGGIQNLSAQTTRANVTKTQIKKQKKIKQGVRSGELTKSEVKQLERQQRNIAQTKRAAKSDGVVTRKEKAIIAK